VNKPNVLFLTIDTLRADRLSCYGFPSPITPNLDRLAAHGVRFEQAITGGSWTQAAFPVLLTSSYAAGYGGCLGPLAAERPEPIAALAQAGYATAGFSTSPLLSRTYNYARDFRHFVDFIPDEKDPSLRTMRGGQKLLRRSLTHAAMKLLGVQTRPAQLYVSAEKVVDGVMGWMRDTAQPFFGWVHFMDVHWPYHREETLTRPAEIAQAWRDLAHLHAANWYGATISPAEKAHYIELYEQAVRFTDAQIGRLFDFLEESGRMENTVIIAVADHGEEFLEHGRWGHWENNLHDEILRVPLLMRAPGVSGGTVISRQVRTIDLMPTVLDICGVPPVAGMAGESLLPLLGGDGEYTAEVSISEMWRDEWHIIAVRTESHKLIWDSRRADAPKFFDLRADPAELRDIAAEQPQMVAALKAHITAHMQHVADTMPADAVVAPDLDDEIVGRLRDLGYME